MTASRPPRLADWLLDRVASGRSAESLIGDLHEQFGRGRSVAWYWRQTTTAIVLELVMKQRLLWVLVPTVVVATLTAALSHHFMPARYQSETLILVVPQRVSQEYVRSSVTTRVEDRLRSITQQVLSRTRLQRIIDDFNLYPELRQTLPMEEVVDRMRSSIRVQVVNNDSFHVSFTSDDPRTAMRVTERLAAVFIAENLRDREVLAEGTITFLETQIDDLRQRIVQKEAQLRQLRATSSGEISQSDLLPYEVFKESYRDLLQKQLDARITANLERRQIGEQFMLLDPARLPEVPLGPRKTSVNVAGTLVGLTLGLVMLMVSRRQKKRAEATDVEAAI